MLPLLLSLDSLDSREVLEMTRQTEAEGRELFPARKEFSELDVVEYFEAAKEAVLKELGPLAASGTS